MSPASKPAKAAKKSGTKPARNSGGAARSIADEAGVSEMIASLATRIVAEFPDSSALLILGIRSRGVILAERLCDLLEDHYGTDVARGVLDITLYRDDLSTLGPQPMVRDSEIPFDLTGTDVVLVDDVLYTGRTIRAALDEIVDFGRPRLIRLAVLIDRGLREYPIQADHVGAAIETTPGEVVHVRLQEVDGRDEVVVVGRA